MKPPSSHGYDKLVANIILERPGITFSALAISTSIWPEDLARLTLGLKQAGIIEHVDGGLRIRTRKKKPEPCPTRWSAVKGWLRERLR